MIRNVHHCKYQCALKKEFLLLKQPRTEEDEGEKGHGSRRHQLKAPQILRRPAVRDSGARLQLELEAGESITALEDILRGTCTKDPKTSTASGRWL